MSYQIKLSPYARIFYTEWLLSPDSHQYNMVCADQTLHGDLDVERLRDALKRYVNEHVVLNSHIQEIDGKPHWVKNAKIFELEYTEYAASKMELMHYVSIPFDLYAGPLYRFRLCRVDSKTYRLIIVMHHLLIDGLSVKNGVIEKIIRYYENMNYSEPLSIEDQVVKIKNITSLLDKNLSVIRKHASDFWASTLNDEHKINLNFLRYKRKNKFSELNNRYKTKGFSFPEDVFLKIKKICRLHSITPYIYGLSIFSVLLKKYSDKETITISYPVAIKEGIDFIYGAQVNTNFISYKIGKKTTIAELFSQAKESFKAARKNGHAYLPIAEIMKNKSKCFLNISFGQGGFRDNPLKFSGVENIKFSEELYIESVSKNNLLFEESISKEGLFYSVRYDSDFFDDELLFYFIENYKKIYVDILNDLICEKYENINSYTVLEHLFYTEINTKSQSICPIENADTLHGLFEEQAIKNPSNIALSYQNNTLTYKDLNEKSNQLAHFIRKTVDIKSENFVALLLDSDHELIISILAVLKLGAAYVPLSISDPEARVNSILSEVMPKLILTKKQYENKISPKGSTLIFNLDEIKLKLNVESASNINSNACYNNLAYVIYTSGTTGNPKGVLQTHGNVVRLFSSTKEQFHFSSTDVWTLFHSYAFDFSIWEMWGALLHGGKLIIPSSHERKDPQLFYELCNQEKVSVINQTPSSFYQFITAAKNSYNPHSLSALRYVILGGDSLSFPLLRPWFDMFGCNEKKLINMYGITETTVHTTYKFIEPEDVDNGINLIGKPISDMKLFVLGSALNILPYGAIGELYVGGNGLARGYLNNPSLTQKKFITNHLKKLNIPSLKDKDKLYKTGDLGRLFPDGSFEYVGRSDSQIKIRGFRIEISEIENTLLQHDDINQAAVIEKKYGDPKTNDSNERYLIAYYTANKKLSDINLISYLKERLPDYMCPRFFVHQHEFPLSTNGKINIKALLLPNVEHKKKCVKASNEEEKLVCDAFSKILFLEEVGIQDDFFDMGGDSILAIKLTFYLQNYFSIRVSDIFEFRTPAEILKNVPFKRGFIFENLDAIKSSPKNNISEKITLPDGYLFREEKVNPNLEREESNILLTGATGFLGCNLLNNLLNECQHNVYVIVRSENKTSAFKKLNDKFLFYFGRSLNFFLDTRLFLICADLEKINFGLSSEDYAELSQIIDTVIHAAALVKHYGNYDTFYSANVKTTVQLLDFSVVGKLKDFHHISTISLLNTEINEQTLSILTEDDLPSNDRQWNSIYNQTKFYAEKKVLEYRDRGIFTSIYRLGNLAFISENARCQENIDENAFFNWIKCLLKIQCFPKEFSHLEISPVDLSAQAIIKLFNNKQLKNNIYHVFNPHQFDMSDFFGKTPIFGMMSLDIAQFIEKIKLMMKSNVHVDLISKFLLHQGWLNTEEQKLPIKVSCLQNRTEFILKQLDFQWMPLDDLTFLKYLNHVND